MAFYTAKYVTALTDLPAKVNGTDVLYFVDGTPGSNVSITTYSTDNEGAVTSSTHTVAEGIVWGVPQASELEYASWSKDITYKTANDSKHGYLITQQVIAQGILSGVYAVDIENRRMHGEYYWTNSAMSDVRVITVNGKVIPQNERIEGRVIPFPLNGDYTEYKKWVSDKIAEFKEPFKDSVRVHVFKNGGAADPLAYQNDSTRTLAKFTGCSYATGVYFLNRDDPQFNGGTAPTTQFYVEGSPVYQILRVSNEYQLSASKSYSNNPARCLLDYLIDPIYGRGLSLGQIDLKSFYNAQVICDQVVVTNVPSEGAYWEGKAQAGSAHSVRLYECNITLDSGAAIRDNITAILATMNDAKLVWSDGKYKLSLAYPGVLPTYSDGEWHGSGTLSVLD